MGYDPGDMRLTDREHVIFDLLLKNENARVPVELLHEAVNEYEHNRFLTDKALPLKERSRPHSRKYLKAFHPVPINAIHAAVVRIGFKLQTTEWVLIRTSKIGRGYPAHYSLLLRENYDPEFIKQVVVGQS